MKTPGWNPAVQVMWGLGRNQDDWIICKSCRDLILLVPLQFSSLEITERRLKTDAILCPCSTPRNMSYCWDVFSLSNITRHTMVAIISLLNCHSSWRSRAVTCYLGFQRSSHFTAVWFSTDQVVHNRFLFDAQFLTRFVSQGQQQSTKRHNNSSFRSSTFHVDPVLLSTNQVVHEHNR
jgi:hypothetical protein